jgi:MarR family transcriptional repressor of mepA
MYSLFFCTLKTHEDLFGNMFLFNQFCVVNYIIDYIYGKINVYNKVIFKHCHSSSIMDLTKEFGVLAIATRLQRLSETFAKDVEMLYKKLYKVDMQPRFFPILMVLKDGKARSVMEIAEEIGFAHTSIIATVRKMEAKDLLKSESHKTDNRKRMLKLTPKGKQLITKLKPVWQQFESVLKDIMNTDNHLVKAIDEVETVLQEESFYKRIEKLNKKK